MNDLRLLIPAAVAWVAAAIVVGVPDWRIAVALWAAAGIAIVVALQRRAAAIVGLTLAAAACCCTSIAIQTQVRAPAELVVAAESGREVDLVAEVTGAGDPVEATILGAPVLVFAEHGAASPRIGELVVVHGTLQATPAGERVRFLVFAGGPLEVVGGQAPVVAWADGLMLMTLEKPMF